MSAFRPSRRGSRSGDDLRGLPPPSSEAAAGRASAPAGLCTAHASMLTRQSTNVPEHRALVGSFPGLLWGASPVPSPRLWGDPTAILGGVPLATLQALRGRGKMPSPPPSLPSFSLFFHCVPPLSQSRLGPAQEQQVTQMRTCCVHHKIPSCHQGPPLRNLSKPVGPGEFTVRASSPAR